MHSPFICHPINCYELISNMQKVQNSTQLILDRKLHGNTVATQLHQLWLEQNRSIHCTFDGTLMTAVGYLCEQTTKRVHANEPEWQEHVVAINLICLECYFGSVPEHDKINNCVTIMTLGPLLMTKNCKESQMKLWHRTNNMKHCSSQI